MPDDYRILGHVDPKWYGSIQTNVQYKGLAIGYFLGDRETAGQQLFISMYFYHPQELLLVNQPVSVLNRWPNYNDQNSLQQYTTGTNDIAKEAMSRFVESNGFIKNTSFARLRNIELSWQLPDAMDEEYFS